MGCFAKKQTETGKRVDIAIGRLLVCRTSELTRSCVHQEYFPSTRCLFTIIFVDLHLFHLVRGPSPSVFSVSPWAPLSLCPFCYSLLHLSQLDFDAFCCCWLVVLCFSLLQRRVCHGRHQRGVPGAPARHEERHHALHEEHGNAECHPKV